jgi:hypothetical protein
MGQAFRLDVLRNLPDGQDLRNESLNPGMPEDCFVI